MRLDRFLPLLLKYSSIIFSCWMTFCQSRPSLIPFRYILTSFRMMWQAYLLYCVFQYVQRHGQRFSVCNSSCRFLHLPRYRIDSAIFDRWWKVCEHMSIAGLSLGIRKYERIRLRYGDSDSLDGCGMLKAETTRACLPELRLTKCKLVGRTDPMCLLFCIPIVAVLVSKGFPQRP